MRWLVPFPEDSRSRTPRLAPLILIAAALLAYANTFRAPFVFDDIAAVTQNPSIEHFTTAFSPPEALSVTGRPLANLSLALNYAISGRDPWSYHALNLALHLANTLLIFALLQHAFASESSPLERGGAQRRGVLARKPATFISLLAALLWSLHPLQTSAVTYVMQRTELLATFCLLATLHAFVRQRYALSVFACACGMAAKETAVVAPLLVLLYDRTFVSGSIRATVRARPRYFAMLAGTWAVLLALLLISEGRGVSAGFGTTLAWNDYAQTQLHAVARYLGLAVWPAPLVFDYGNGVIREPVRLLVGAVVVLALAALTFRQWRRNRRSAFCGALFLVALAPSSSVIPIATQTIAEHRVYLALVAMAVLAAAACGVALGRRALLPACVVAAAFATLTFARNRDYGSVFSLWHDTATKAPANARAHYNLGLAALDARRLAAAEQAFSAAITADPHHGPAHLKRGTLRAATGRVAEALPDLAAAVRLLPASSAAHYNYGRALTDARDYRTALAEFEAAAKLDPSDASARKNAEALREYLK